MGYKVEAKEVVKSGNGSRQEWTLTVTSCLLLQKTASRKACLQFSVSSKKLLLGKVSTFQPSGRLQILHILEIDLETCIHLCGIGFLP